MTDVAWTFPVLGVRAVASKGLVPLRGRGVGVGESTKPPDFTSAVHCVPTSYTKRRRSRKAKENKKSRLDPVSHLSHD
jgi:hypothetical protein